MAVKVCEKCGENNSENATSCIICGASLLNVKSTGLSDEEKFPKEKRCPSCNKIVKSNLSMCPYCGSILKEKKKIYYTNTNTEDSANNIVIYILSFLIPLVGIIVGAIWLSDINKRDEGGTAIGAAILGVILYVVLCSVLL